MSVRGVEAVRVLQDDVLTVIRSLSDEEWQRPSGCAGWRVQDLVAHMSSNFQVTVEPPDAAPTDGPPVAAEQAMEMLVEPRRGWSAQQVLAEYEEFAPRALAVLASLQEEPAASAPLPLADLGTYPTNLLADAYAFDHYCHLRVDLLRPLGPIERKLPPADDVRLGPTVGWMIAGLPQMCSRSLTALDRPLQLVLDGPGGGTWTLDRERPDALVQVAPGATGEAAATVRSTSHDFVIWGTTRRSWRDHVTVEGDAAYAASVLDQLDII